MLDTPTTRCNDTQAGQRPRDGGFGSGQKRNENSIAFADNLQLIGYTYLVRLINSSYKWRGYPHRAHGKVAV